VQYYFEFITFTAWNIIVTASWLWTLVAKFWSSISSQFHQHPIIELVFFNALQCCPVNLFMGLKTFLPNSSAWIPYIPIPASHPSDLLNVAVLIVGDNLFKSWNL
jgi:hypothetical protein